MAASETSSRLEEHLDTVVMVHAPADGGSGRGRNGAAPLELRASAYVLARWSRYFKAALSGDWNHSGVKRIELTDDPQAVEHLFQFMHSMGNHSKLPQDVESLMRLLPTAHALEVEACVAAAAARLEAQARELDWDTALQALDMVEGRDCLDPGAQRRLDELQRAVLRQLLKLLGRLDDVLQDDNKRRRFCQLPLAVLEGIFASERLLVDCEETAFCAFAHWMNRQEGLTPEQRVAATACILPLIRFTAMRATSVVSYWHAYRWFREWDPHKTVLLQALVSMAESHPEAQPSQLSAEVSTTAQRRRLGCPMTPPPLRHFVPIDVSDGGEGPFDGPWCYWAGYWWRTQADKFPSAQRRDAGPTLGLCLVCGLPPGAEVASEGLVGDKAVGPTVAFELRVVHAHEAGGALRVGLAARSEGSVFKPLWQPASKQPSFRNGWDAFPLPVSMPDGSPIRWNNFRQPGSPIVRNGQLAVHVEATWDVPF